MPGEYAVNADLHYMQKLDEPITVLHHVRSSLVNLLTRRVIQNSPYVLVYPPLLCLQTLSDLLWRVSTVTLPVHMI